MKTKILVLLLAVFALNSCTTDEFAPSEEYETTEQKDDPGIVPGGVYYYYTKFDHDVYFSAELSNTEVRNLSIYYLSKYSDDFFTRVRMLDALPGETHHERWTVEYCSLQHKPEQNVYTEDDQDEDIDID